MIGTVLVLAGICCVWAVFGPRVLLTLLVLPVVLFLAAAVVIEIRDDLADRNVTSSSTQWILQK